MLHSAHPGLAQAQNGAKTGINHMIMQRWDFDIQIGAMEDNSITRGGRCQASAYLNTGMQADPGKADPGLQCPAPTGTRSDITVHQKPCPGGRRGRPFFTESRLREPSLH